MGGRKESADASILFRKDQGETHVEVLGGMCDTVWLGNAWVLLLSVESELLSATTEL